MLDAEGSASVLKVDMTSADTLARRPGSLGSSPRDREQALRLIRDLAVLGALLAQNPPQAVIPDLPVQAVQPLNAHLRRLMDVLEQLDIVHIGSPRS